MGGAGVVRRKYPGHPSVTAHTIPDWGRLFPALLSGSVGQVSFVKHGAHRYIEWTILDS